MNRKLSFRSAFFIILLSILVVSGTSFLGWVYLDSIKEQRKRSDKYVITAIVQSCSNGPALPTLFLAELFELSVDKPTNLYLFNSKEALRKLVECPFIKEASLKKISPGTIYVEYKLRRPVAFVADLVNTAVDSEGAFFPYAPFFPAKDLPQIYLGDENVQDLKQLALELLHLLEKEKILFKRIDVSRACAPSCGQREVVIIAGHYILRLAAEDYSQQIANFLALKRHLGAHQDFRPAVIDLRIQDLAFISLNL